MEFFLPEVVLAVGALFLINALLLQQNILSKYNRIYSTSSAALIIMLVVYSGAILGVLQQNAFTLVEPNLAFHSNYYISANKLLVLIFSIGALMLPSVYAKYSLVESPLTYAIFSICVCAGLLLLSSADLLSIYFILEVQSFCFYYFASSNPKSLLSLEGSIKYFIISAFSSAFFLLAIALTYANFGTTNLLDLRHITAF
jgi:NADH:ubiquinone oxidoreductase subunit 2 (subunit N)